MAMWVYVREPDTPGIKEHMITNAYLRELMPEDDEYEANFTDEAIHYVRELVRPLIARLNTIKSEDDLRAFAQTIPYTHDIRFYGGLECSKEIVLKAILGLLIYDNEQDEPGLHRDGSIIDPWMVHHYINERDPLRLFFNPPPVMVDVLLNGVRSHLPITYDQVLGVMAVYRSLHRSHPFSMYGFPLTSVVKEVNEKALNEYVRDYDNWYNVSVAQRWKGTEKTDVYSFEGTDFFQGLLTGAQWNNIDPHTFITDLKQWKEERAPQNQGIPTLGPGIEFQVPRRYTVDLQY